MVVLLSAPLHAGWNALVKFRGDRGDPLIVLASVALSAALLSSAAVPFVPLPRGQVWAYLLFSMTLHTAYNVLLYAAYRHGDMGQVYPIARGLAPMIVALVSPLVTAEVLSNQTLAGVFLITLGVASLALRGVTGSGGSGPGLWRRWLPVACAALAAVFIAAYTMVDGLGARLAETPHGYIAWLFVLDGIPITLIAYGKHRRSAIAWARTHWRDAAAGGAMSLAAYWFVIWALTLGPLAPVAALRETSVIFGALLSSMLLKERFGAWRAAAASVVAAGAALVS